VQAWLRDVVFERFQAFAGAGLGVCIGFALVGALDGIGPWRAAGAIGALAASQALAFPVAARTSGAAGPAGSAARLYRDLVFVLGLAALAAIGAAGLHALVQVGAASAAGATGAGATGAAWVAAAGLASAGVLLSGHALRPRRVRVSQQRVAFPEGAPALRIAHVSDLHLGNGTGVVRVERLVRQTNALGADLVALTGDLFDGPAELLAPGARALAGLRAPLGVFAVLGNHDVGLGAERVARALAEHAPDIALLRGEGRRVDLAGGALWIGGVDDPGRDWTRGGHLPALAALAARRPPGVASLLLVHRPDAFPEAAELGFDLVLSGHYHGGQVALPGSGGRLGPATLLTPFARGVHRRGDATLFVSRGIGYAGPRFRLGSPPELAVLACAPAPEAAAS